MPNYLVPFKKRNFGSWKVVTFVEVQWPLRFYAAAFPRVLAFNLGSQLKERAFCAKGAHRPASGLSPNFIRSILSELLV